MRLILTATAAVLLTAVAFVSLGWAQPPAADALSQEVHEYASDEAIRSEVQDLTPEDIAALLQAAQSGDTDAELRLGVAYFFSGLVRSSGQVAPYAKLGTGIQENHSEAAYWLRSPAEQGSGLAQCTLGTIYAGGLSGPADYSEALMWFTMAADHDQNCGYLHLGYMCHNGEGVPQDYAEAAKWYRKAADRGSPEAAQELRRMYARGLIDVPEEQIEQDGCARICASIYENCEEIMGKNDPKCKQDRYNCTHGWCSIESE